MEFCRGMDHLFLLMFSTMALKSASKVYKNQIMIWQSLKMSISIKVL